MKVTCVGELKKVLENVSDDYELVISLEGVGVSDVIVDDEEKLVDFLY